MKILLEIFIIPHLNFYQSNKFQVASSSTMLQCDTKEIDSIDQTKEKKNNENSTKVGSTRKLIKSLSEAAEKTKIGKID